jgi:hypothetical protein
MTPTTRSTPRQGARFGRTSPSSSTGRFSRPGTSPSRGRRTTTRATSRMPALHGRTSTAKRKQRRSLGGMLAGLLPGRGASKATPGSKGGRAGGVALLAGAAGVAFRNRDKLTAMLQRKRGNAAEPETPAHAATRPEPANTPGV